MLFLIDGLRSSDFGKKQINDEEDIDEEQLLNNSLSLKSNKNFNLFTNFYYLIDKKNELKSIKDNAERFIPTVELTESELNSFSNTNKRFTFIDIYQNGNTLNKVFV